MLASISGWFISHRSAILATLVVVQNSKVLHGTWNTVAAAVVALMGG